MLGYLTSYFRDDSCEAGYSLAIHGGKEGARLSHNHERCGIHRGGGGGRGSCPVQVDGGEEGRVAVSDRCQAVSGIVG